MFIEMIVVERKSKEMIVVERTSPLRFQLSRGKKAIILVSFLKTLKYRALGDSSNDR
jgi:hypothetical protein